MGRPIDILGPVPPPYGGVSIHIVRFAAMLRDRGHEVRVFPYTGTMLRHRLGKAVEAAWRIAKIFTAQYRDRRRIMHIHYGGLGQLLALVPVLRPQSVRLVMTFHSVRVCQDLEAARPALRRRALSVLRDVHQFVVVRPEIGEALRAQGLLDQPYFVMPAFLPPADSEADLALLPDSLATDLSTGIASGRLQVCCGAYYLGPGYGHEDIYGVEELVAALEQLDNADGQPADFWILVSNSPGTPELKELDKDLRRRAARWRKFGLQLHYGIPMIPLLARASAFVRPSREDGDSVAVREALCFGLPVLASDVVARPPGVVTYSPGSPDGLARELMGFLAQIALPKYGPSRSGSFDQARFDDFVNTVIGEKPGSGRFDADGEKG